MTKLLMVGAATLLMTTTVAMAQSPASDRGIWDGRDHQPTRAQTVQKEKAAGVEPTESERAYEKATVGQIDQRLLGGSPYSPVNGTSSTDQIRR